MAPTTRRDLLSLGMAFSASALLSRSAFSQALFQAQGQQISPSGTAANRNPEASGEIGPTPTPAQAPPLSWERDHTFRVPWSEHLITEVTRFFPVLNAAKDIREFYPHYPSVEDAMKIAFWAELFVELAFYESAWNPCARYKETGLGIDPITEQPVYSEGLLQLSYQDENAYPGLPFDWEKDKLLDPTDCSKSILDPLKNLSAGVRILAAQIDSYGKIVLGKNIYWSTLQDPSVGRHSAVPKIRLIVSRWSAAAIAG